MPGRVNIAADLALGTVQWGLDYGIANRHGKPSRGEVRRLLDRAANVGITTLDTARAYADSEDVIGQLVGDAAPWRVFTKLDPTVETVGDASNSLQASRKALKRSMLDGVLLHRARQRAIADGGVWDLLQRERDAGRICHIGISAASPDEAWAALEDPSVTCVQVACSLFDQRLSRAGFFSECHRRGLLVFVRSVFLQGAAHLAPENLPAHLRELRDPLRTIHLWAAERQTRPTTAFLAFAASLVGASILLGCETTAQLDDNLAQWDFARKAASEIGSLADSMVGLAPEVLNPALWPKVAI